MIYRIQRGRKPFVGLHALLDSGFDILNSSLEVPMARAGRDGRMVGMRCLQHYFIVGYGTVCVACARKIEAANKDRAHRPYIRFRVMQPGDRIPACRSCQQSITPQYFRYFDHDAWTE